MLGQVRGPADAAFNFIHDSVAALYNRIGHQLRGHHRHPGLTAGRQHRPSVDASSSLVDDKVALDARDDAASFIASEGSILGVRTEAALQRVRQRLPSLVADDLRLAEAILAH